MTRPLRESCLALALLALWVGGLAVKDEVRAAPAASQPQSAAGDPAAVEEAIGRALDYLEGQQHPEGFWENANRVNRPWATSWALLAYMANGHTARAGKYQETVKKGLAWLARGLEGDGAGETRSLGVLALLASLGQGPDEAPDEDIVILCEKHVRALIDRQIRSGGGSGTRALDVEFNAGGWGNTVESYWNTICLVAADRCGMRVPRVVFDDLRAYWKRRYLVASGDFYDQSMFSFRSASSSYGLALTNKAVLALCLLGERKSQEAQGGFGTLLKARPGDPDWFWGLSEECRGINEGKAAMLGTWFVAVKLMGAQAHDLRRWRAEYSAAILHDQTDNGAFRLPGWDCQEKWSKNDTDRRYGGNVWLWHILGYGTGWSDANLAAHAAFGLALPKGYLPWMTPMREP